MKEKNHLNDAEEALNNGELVIYPTETCYGIGCDAMNNEALEKVYQAKKRPREKKLTSIVSSLDMAERYCNLSELEMKVCKEFMPGPLTLVADKKPEVPDLLNDSFVFRVPDHEFCREMCRKFGGPVVATSANISGKPSSYSVDEIDPELRDKAEVIVDHGELEGNQPSTIIDIEGGELNVHREGPVNPEDIRGVIDGS